MRMDCSRAREGLWPPERPRLAEDEILAARRHVETCAACREYFAQDRLLLQLHDRLRQQKAPDDLRERIFDALARERTLGHDTEAAPRGASGVPRRSLVATVVAGLALILLGTLAAVGWPWAAGSADSPDDGRMFIEDYLRRAVSEDYIVTSDPAEVARFLARELGVALAPLKAPGLRLTRAEICLLEGRRGAMIVYAIAGHTVSHYLVPSNGGEAKAPALAAPAAAGSPGQPAPTVVTWATPSLEQAVVGALPPEHLLSLARGAAR